MNITKQDRKLTEEKFIKMTGAKKNSSEYEAYSLGFSHGRLCEMDRQVEKLKGKIDEFRNNPNKS